MEMENLENTNNIENISDSTSLDMPNIELSENIRNILENLPEWEKMSQEDKVGFLRDIETCSADMENRDPRTVEIGDIRAGIKCDDKVIQISGKLLQEMNQMDETILKKLQNEVFSTVEKSKPNSISFNGCSNCCSSCSGSCQFSCSGSCAYSSN